MFLYMFYVVKQFKINFHIGSFTINTDTMEILPLRLHYLFVLLYIIYTTPHVKDH